MIEYQRARYAQWLGRWANADPTRTGNGPNLYRYVRNNPVALTDPSGTQPALPEDKGTQFGRGPFKSSIPPPSPASDPLPIDFGDGLSGAVWIEEPEPEPEPSGGERWGWFKRNVVSRALGVAKIGAGTAGFVVGAALCKTGLGCIAGAAHDRIGRRRGTGWRPSHRRRPGSDRCRSRLWPQGPRTRLSLLLCRRASARELRSANERPLSVRVLEAFCRHLDFFGDLVGLHHRLKDDRRRWDYAGNLSYSPNGRHAQRSVARFGIQLTEVDLLEAVTEASENASCHAEGRIDLTGMT